MTKKKVGVLHVSSGLEWIWWCVSLPEQRAVGIGSGPAPGKGGGDGEIVHAQWWSLPPAGLLALWEKGGWALPWSLLLVHLPGRQLEDTKYVFFDFPKIFFFIFLNAWTVTPPLYLPQWCLPGFLWDVELTATGLRRSEVDGISTFEVASRQVLWVTASPWSIGGGQRRVSALLTPGGCGSWGRWVHKVHRGIVHIFLLHQEGITAGGGAQPPSGRGAGGGTRAWGAGASVPVGEGIQQREVETLSVPATTTPITHIPVPGDSGSRLIFWGDGGYLNTWTLDHTGLGDLKGKRGNQCVKKC